MLFLLGIVAGLAAGVLFHVRRSTEQRQAIQALTAQNEILRRGERPNDSDRQLALLRAREVKLTAELRAAQAQIQEFKTTSDLRKYALVMPTQKLSNGRALVH